MFLVNSAERTVLGRLGCRVAGRDSRRGSTASRFRLVRGRRRDCRLPAIGHSWLFRYRGLAVNDSGGSGRRFDGAPRIIIMMTSRIRSWHSVGGGGEFGVVRLELRRMHCPQ
jgi:hypothetical protein